MKKIYSTFFVLFMMFICTTAKAENEAIHAWGAVMFRYITTPMYDANETIEISADSIKFFSDTWGNGRFDQTSGEGVLAMDNHRGGVSDYAATISGSVSDGFVITVPSVMGGTTITVTIGTMPVALNAVSTYKAGTYANCAYFQKYMPTADQKISIIANAGYETVNITHTSSTWGTFTFEAATVEQTGEGSYTITATEGNCAMPSMRDPSVITDYAATFSGTLTDGVLTAELSIPAVMGGTTVMFNPADFDEVYEIATAVETIADDANSDEPVFNLSGVRVDSSYKGIVIKGGKKYIQK